MGQLLICRRRDDDNDDDGDDDDTQRVRNWETRPVPEVLPVAKLVTGRSELHVS